jgi:hypothetical protein
MCHRLAMTWQNYFEEGVTNAAQIVLHWLRFLRRHVAHFGTLTPEATKVIAAKVTAHSVSKGALLCRQGALADSLLVMLRGHAAVYVDKKIKAESSEQQDMHSLSAASSGGFRDTMGIQAVTSTLMIDRDVSHGWFKGAYWHWMWTQHVSRGDQVEGRLANNASAAGDAPFPEVSKAETSKGPSTKPGEAQIAACQQLALATAAMASGVAGMLLDLLTEAATAAGSTAGPSRSIWKVAAGIVREGGALQPEAGGGRASEEVAGPVASDLTRRFQDGGEELGNTPHVVTGVARQCFPRGVRRAGSTGAAPLRASTNSAASAVRMHALACEPPVDTQGRVHVQHAARGHQVSSQGSLCSSALDCVAGASSVKLGVDRGVLKGEAGGAGRHKNSAARGKVSRGLTLLPIVCLKMACIAPSN